MELLLTRNNPKTYIRSFEGNQTHGRRWNFEKFFLRRSCIVEQTTRSSWKILGRYRTCLLRIEMYIVVHKRQIAVKEKQEEWVSQLWRWSTHKHWPRWYRYYMSSERWPLSAVKLITAKMADAVIGDVKVNSVAGKLRWHCWRSTDSIEEIVEVVEATAAIHSISNEPKGRAQPDPLIY